MRLPMIKKIDTRKGTIARLYYIDIHNYCIVTTIGKIQFMSVQYVQCSFLQRLRMFQNDLYAN